MHTLHKKPQKRRLILAVGLILGTICLSSYVKSRGLAVTNPTLLGTANVWEIKNTTNDNVIISTSLAKQIIPAGQTGFLQKTSNAKVTITAPATGQQLTTTLSTSKTQIAPDNDAGLFFVQPQ